MLSNGEKFETKTKTLFKIWSKFYDSAFIRFIYFEHIYRKILETLTDQELSYLKPDSKFLDVACGTGEIIFRLAKEFPGAEFTGIDFSREMLEIAIEKNRNFKNVDLSLANVKRLPFKNNTFDIILCSDAFHHFEAPLESLREMNRVLKKDGFLLLIDPVFDTLLQRIVMNVVLRIVDRPKHYYSKNEMLELLEKANFEVESSFIHYFNNFFICKK